MPNMLRATSAKEDCPKAIFALGPQGRRVLTTELARHLGVRKPSVTAMAHLLTDRLSVMLLATALIGVACSMAGCLLARAVDASIAGLMVTAMGAAFLHAWPRRRVRTVVDVLLRDGLVAREERGLRPTLAGLAFVQAVVE